MFNKLIKLVHVFSYIAVTLFVIGLYLLIVFSPETELLAQPLLFVEHFTIFDLSLSLISFGFIFSIFLLTGIFIYQQNNTIDETYDELGITLK